MAEQLDLFQHIVPEADSNIKIGDCVQPKHPFPEFGIHPETSYRVSMIRSYKDQPKYLVGGLWYMKSELTKI